jgi:hypothetical protein
MNIRYEPTFYDDRIDFNISRTINMSSISKLVPEAEKIFTPPSYQATKPDTDAMNVICPSPETQN